MPDETTTKALMMTGYGALTENLLFQTRKLRSPKINEVLIQVHAASINPIDYKIVDGLLKRMEKLDFPAPMGFDAAGKILSVGAGVTRFQEGDDVYLRTDRYNKGSFAQKMLALESQLSRKPANLSYAEAASLPLVALTTIQHLKEYANAQKGEHLFVNAGAGGIGTFTIQYAKALGLEVTVQCNSRDEAFLKRLGVDQFIFYDQEDYLTKGPIFDIVYDCLGGAHTIKSFSVVKKGGIVASIAGPPDRDFANREKLGILPKIFMWKMNRKVYAAARKSGARYVRALTRSDGRQLEELATLVESGKISSIIDRTFPFKESIDALAYVKKGKSKGKVVITMDDTTIGQS